jgi:hypothetical protein
MRKKKVGDVQTRIANSNRAATTKWIEGALSFFQTFFFIFQL